MLDRLWLPHDISTLGPRIDFLFQLIFWITVIAWVLVTVGMIAFMVKHRSRPGLKASHVEGNPRLELLWTSVTAIILVALVALALMSRSTWAGVKEKGPSSRMRRPPAEWTFQASGGRSIHDETFTR